MQFHLFVRAWKHILGFVSGRIYIFTNVDIERLLLFNISHIPVFFAIIIYTLKYKININSDFV